MGSKEKREFKANIGVVKIIYIVAISFYALVSVSAAYERPAVDTALTAPWHPGGYCIPCHYSLMTLDKAKNISNTCGCHNLRPAGQTSGYKIDMSKIYGIHNNIICIRCHIGMKNQDGVTAQDFHRIMPIACSNCHTYTNGTIQIPDKKNCSDCHADGNPHVVHGNKIETLCVACHGEDFASKYTSGIVSIPNNNGTTAKPVGVSFTDYPTITRFLYKIFGTIMKIGG